MPIPNSGALSLTTIQTEFGGSNPISISEYYAGGGLVPPGTSGTNGAVPASGTISFSKFYGTSNVAPLTVSVSPTVVAGIFTNSPAANAPASRTVTSSSTTATPSGGVGPYTYAWARVSGDVIAAVSSTSATTTFSGSVPIDLNTAAVMRVTVTDGASNTATADVNVALEYFSGF